MTASDTTLLVVGASTLVVVLLTFLFNYTTLRYNSERQRQLLKQAQYEDRRRLEFMTADLAKLLERFDSLSSFLPHLMDASGDLENTSLQLRRMLEYLNDQLARSDIPQASKPTKSISSFKTPSAPGSAYEHAAAQYAHSIKTPLSAIESAIADAEAYIRRSLPPDAEAENLLSLVTASLLGARRAIEAIKAILETGAGLVATEEVADLFISELAHQAERMSRAATRSSTPTTYHALNELPRFRLQKANILVVLTILMENAFEAATRPSDLVEISGRYDLESHELTISVANAGPKVPSGLKDRLFHEQVSTKGGPGRGTGLLVAQEWIEQVGGQVVLAYSNDERTCFEIHIEAQVV